MSELVSRFSAQAQSGLTVKDWCSQNQISFHAYNYWKHKIKMLCLDNVIPDGSDIVPLSLPSVSASIPLPSSKPSVSFTSKRRCPETGPAYISMDDIRMEVSPSISDDKLLRILKASVMLRDANFSPFIAVYIMCGRTDMRLGMDSLASIIENRFHLPLFVPNTLFLFCGKRASRIKGLL